MKRRVIGLDAGGTKLLAGVVDEDGRVLFQTFRSWPRETTREDVLLRFQTALQEARRHSDGVEAVGAAIPANVDLASGTAISCRHLPITGFAFRDWLGEVSGLPAYIDNDATAAMLAEHRLGAARGADEAVMLTIGTGIGGGIVSSGRVVRGVHGAAGEPGHMSIDMDGPPCPGDCPGRGCLEVYVSGPALARMGYEYAALGPDYNLGRILAARGELTGADVVQAAKAGDAGAREALQRMGESLGIGIANLLNLLDPEVVVIGGGAGANAGRLLLETAERVARERALEPAASDARIEVAELGEGSAMIGAGLLALAGGDA
jgi:glucokinase